MKVTKGHLGKRVSLTWLDPVTDRVKEKFKGREALARWTEEGIIDDITDGVVRLQKSEGYSPRMREPDEWEYTWVLEDLIVDIKEVPSAGTTA